MKEIKTNEIVSVQNSEKTVENVHKDVVNLKIFTRKEIEYYVNINTLYFKNVVNKYYPVKIYKDKESGYIKMSVDHILPLEPEANKVNNRENTETSVEVNVNANDKVFAYNNNKNIIFRPLNHFVRLGPTHKSEVFQKKVQSFVKTIENRGISIHGNALTELTVSAIKIREEFYKMSETCQTTNDPNEVSIDEAKLIKRYKIIIMTIFILLYLQNRKFYYKVKIDSQGRIYYLCGNLSVTNNKLVRQLVKLPYPISNILTKDSICRIMRFENVKSTEFITFQRDLKNIKPKSINLDIVASHVLIIGLINKDIVILSEKMCGLIQTNSGQDVQIATPDPYIGLFTYFESLKKVTTGSCDGVQRKTKKNFILIKINGAGSARICKDLGITPDQYDYMTLVYNNVFKFNKHKIISFLKEKGYVIESPFMRLDLNPYEEYTRFARYLQFVEAAILHGIIVKIQDCGFCILSVHDMYVIHDSANDSGKRLITICFNEAVLDLLKFGTLVVENSPENDEFYRRLDYSKALKVEEKIIETDYTFDIDYVSDVNIGTDIPNFFEEEIQEQIELGNELVLSTNFQASTFFCNYTIFNSLCIR
jgi:hypothetical protein